MLKRPSFWMCNSALVCLLTACGGRARGDNNDSSTGGDLSSLAGGSSDTTGGAGGVLIGAGGSPASGGFSSGGNDTLGGSGAGENAGGSSIGEFCEWGSFDTDLSDDKLTCKPWSACAPGTYQTDAGGFTRDVSCTTCPDGKYTESEDALRCEWWQKCHIGEQVSTSPSASQDRSCEEADFFPRSKFGENAGAFTVTDQGLYLLAGNSGGSSRPDLLNYGHLLRYLPEGDAIENFLLPTNGLRDLTHLGTDLYVTGANSFRENGVFSEPAHLHKVSAAGSLLWNRSLSTDTDDHYAHTVVTAGNDLIYVLTKVVEKNCVFDDQTESCTATGAAPRLELHVFDTAGQSLLATSVENDTNVDLISDFERATDGHLYAALTRMDIQKPTNCEDLPDEHYYYYYCVVGVQVFHDVIVELDEAGAVLAEHELPSGEIVLQLSADEQGSVYALTDSFSSTSARQRLLRVATGGQLRLDTTLESSEETLSVLAAVDGGVLLAGRTSGPQRESPTEGVLLLRTDPSGLQLERDVLSYLSPSYALSGLVQTSDGSVFLAGGNFGAFVMKWPD